MEMNEGLQRIRQLSVDVQVAMLQLESQMKAFEAAATANIPAMMEQYRTQIHATTDTLLDLKATVGTISRRIAMG